MKKNFKWLTVLAVMGTVIGLIIAYVMRKNNEISDFMLQFTAQPAANCNASSPLKSRLTARGWMYATAILPAGCLAAWCKAP